jgi:TPR repeat protein
MRLMKKIIFFIGVVLAVGCNAEPLGDAIKFFQENQYSKALPLFQMQSEKGDAESQGYLASMYLNGLGVERNYEKALNWASKSAAKNNSIGQEVLGVLYLKGQGGLIQDKLKALSYFQKAALQNNSSAVSLYAQTILQGHSKENLNEIERSLIKDRSLSSFLILSELYGNGNYKPSNLYKSFSYALEAIKRGSSSPIWHIVENSNYLQFSDTLNAAWLKALKDLKNPELKYYPNFENEFEDSISSLRPDQIREVKNIKLNELILKTEKFIKEHQKKYGPILAVDFINEGWRQFVGERGDVNEPLAQLILEEGLRKSIYLRQTSLANYARNNLGVVLGAAVNKNIRNERLAKVHIIDGIDTRFGPDNLIWAVYQGEIELPREKYQDLLKRFREIDGQEHIVESLGPLPKEFKNKPDQIIRFYIKKYEEKPNYQLAEQIADMYEDNYFDIANLREAEKWYEISYKMQGEDQNLRLHRIRKILSGNYVKDMPDMRNSINTLFEISSSIEQNQSAASFVPTKEAKSPSSKVTLHALVIGNSRYQSGRLNNAVNDANLMAARLRELGFNVTFANDLNRKAFQTALLNFSSKAKNADVTVFYYSGHGMQLGGINYLLPTDINLKDREEIVANDGISLNDLIRRNLPGKSRLIFLDACRTKPFKSSSGTLANYGLAPVNVPHGTLISFATKDGSVAFDGPEGKNSPYTESLANLIGDKDDIAILLRNVRDRVLRITQGKQVPWEYGSLSGGKFVLSNLSNQ